MSAVAVTLEQAAGFGGGEEGMTRLAWSKEIFDVYDWLGKQLRELGLDVEIDAAGNLLARWEIGSGKAVLVGSHLDTVPHGGRYDGALGVLAGFHAIRLLKEWGVEPRRPVWLVVVHGRGGRTVRDSALRQPSVCRRRHGELADRRDVAGISLREAMTAAGFDFERLPQARRIDEIGAYLELHIEQGPVLEQEGIELGIVTGIVGVLGFRARFLGEANHAGTTPMRMRRDALAVRLPRRPRAPRGSPGARRHYDERRHHLGRAGWVQRRPWSRGVHDRHSFGNARRVRDARAAGARDA